VHYPLIVALPPSTSYDELADRLDDAMSPFYEYRDTEYVDADGELLPNGKWDHYTIGGLYRGFFLARPGAEPTDLITIQETKDRRYCNGGRVRGLDLEGMRADAARLLAGSRPKTTAAEADMHWDDILTWVRDTAIPTGAVLSHTGEWIAPDDARFVSMPFTHRPEHLAFLTNANDYLDSLPGDAVLMIVECHT
jgi:hypothetical protein